MLFLKACYSSQWLGFTSIETGVLPKMAFLSLQSVTSHFQSLLSSFWIDIFAACIY